MLFSDIFRKFADATDPKTSITAHNMHICYIVAMRAEARPFIEAYGLEPVSDAFAPLPCLRYEGAAGAHRLSVVLPGEQHGSDLVGCEAAVLATHLAVSQLKPDLVINSGTCGGWKKHGAQIARVYIADGVMFHDRRIPGDDAWTTQSLGNYPVWAGSAALAERLGMPMGKVTTGSSLDLQPCDAEIIEAHGGRLKDMEGAAVAFVCSLYGVPVMLVKSVTDLCDDSADTLDTFRQNLAAASEALRKANERIIAEIGD